MIALLRRELPGLGTRKLYWCLREAFKTHDIKMGRDKLHEDTAQKWFAHQKKDEGFQKQPIPGTG